MKVDSQPNAVVQQLLSAMASGLSRSQGESAQAERAAPDRSPLAQLVQMLPRDVKDELLRALLSLVMGGDFKNKGPSDPRVAPPLPNYGAGPMQPREPSKMPSIDPPGVGGGSMPRSDGPVVDGIFGDRLAPPDAHMYWGLPKDEAIAKAKERCPSVGLGSVDGEMSPRTMQFQRDRLNFDVENGKVTRAYMG